MLITPTLMFDRKVRVIRTLLAKFYLYNLLIFNKSTAVFFSIVVFHDSQLTALKLQTKTSEICYILNESGVGSRNKAHLVKPYKISVIRI